ncbi:MFS transporter [Microbacterium pseudoresistens]|uniref:MFS family permease n=1 Tax=Microbacterium pseudoresistens TaxID=640634 RepID=A0A7Y9ESJ9_9MICO|nr:MFS family permease [Microbacterium pseudoresistens]
MSATAVHPGFAAWVGATFALELGSGLLAFALTWTASGYGSFEAAILLALTIAPTVVLTLFAGTLSDRFGPRRVLVVTTSGMVVIAGSIATATTVLPGEPGVLLVAAVLIGTVSAFFRPAAGVFPRLFVADHDLGIAMARVGLASQLARTIGPPLGGILLGALTLSGVAWLDAFGSLAMLGALLLIHPPKRVLEHVDRVTLREAFAVVPAIRRASGAGAVLLGIAIVAGAVIPVVTLGIPLAARERGWTVVDAGIIESGWILGGIVCGAWFAWRGTIMRVMRPITLGPIIVAAGLVLLALASHPLVATIGTAVLGAGVVVFTAHAFPTYILLAPKALMTRFQSVLIFIQLTPQLFINPLIGAGVDLFTTAPVIIGAGVLAIAAAGVMLANKRLRALGEDTGTEDG